jgi:hypothetical protein
MRTGGRSLPEKEGAHEDKAKHTTTSLTCPRLFFVMERCVVCVRFVKQKGEQEKSRERGEATWE